MKKSILFLVLFVAATIHAQEIRQIPMVNVSGEGKVKVVPDQAAITVSVESKGSNSADVKRDNDTKIDAVLKAIKSANIAKEDFQTQRVNLYPNYDYERKKSNYIATQTVAILLRDLSKYDGLIDALISTGVNRIDNVEFKSSKLPQLQSEARKLAVKDAKAKADDFVSALGQKAGKAIIISDNSQNNYPPRPVMYEMKAMAADGAQRETLAPGEMEVIINVNVSFVLE
jgi:uncharacterized protein YggE